MGLGDFMDTDMSLLEFAWYGHVIGRFSVKPDNSIDWKGEDHPFPYLFFGESKRTPPTLLKHLAPEGWLNDILNNPDRSVYFEKGIRFLSNITISKNAECVYQTLDIDRILTPLNDHTSDKGVFTGNYEGPSPQENRRAFRDSLAIYMRSKTMPKFSGAQLKIPASLFPTEEGNSILMPANSSVFSHILKFPGTDYFEPIASLEWMGLQISQSIGLKTSKHSLVDLGHKEAPALLVERFDIPQNDEDRNKYLIADFTTITGLDPKIHKYGQNAELLGKKILEISSNPEQDTRDFFKRNILAYFLGDLDMHMKNVSVLTVINPDSNTIETRLSPVYDTLCTMALPSKGDQNLSLKIAGKNSNLREANFVQFGRSLLIDEEEARHILRETAEEIAKKAIEIASNPPDPIVNNERCLFSLKHAATEVVEKVKAFGFNTPNWEPVKPDKERRREMRASVADSLVLG